jgi:GrpB-like predicted nucleotidyltransferase (UPF0157 family)
VTVPVLEPVVPYDPSWPAQFTALGGRLRALLGEAAKRIDHIGSTAVPGLVAKDVIDVQVTVASLDDPSLASLDRAGFVRRAITHDHEPPGVSLPAAELEKRYFNGVPGERRANIHVRADGRFNARYALLCRDYLRSHPLAASAYGAVKLALARIVEGDVEAYYEVKDPVFDILMAGAEDWAQHAAWRPGPTDA